MSRKRKQQSATKTGPDGRNDMGINLSYEGREKTAVQLVKTKVLSIPLDKWEYGNVEKNRLTSVLKGKQIVIFLATVFEKSICVLFVDDFKVIENDNDIFQHSGVIKNYLKAHEEKKWLEKVEAIAKSLH